MSLVVLLRDIFLRAAECCTSQNPMMFHYHKCISMFCVLQKTTYDRTFHESLDPELVILGPMETQEMKPLQYSLQARIIVPIFSVEKYILSIEVGKNLCTTYFIETNRHSD